MIRRAPSVACVPTPRKLHENLPNHLLNNRHLLHLRHPGRLICQRPQTSNQAIRNPSSTNDPLRNASTSGIKVCVAKISDVCPESRSTYHAICPARRTAYVESCTNGPG